MSGVLQANYAFEGDATAGIFLIALDLEYVWRYMDHADLRIRVLLPIRRTFLGEGEHGYQ